MSTQDKFWSLAARSYEDDFIDPYRADVRNPLLKAQAQHPNRLMERMADLL